MLPLSVAELRKRREVYLARIAQGLGLSKPLATQEECYDVFADFYLTTHRSLAAAMESIVKVITSGRIAIWDRDDLVRRLQAGGIIPGFSYDEETRLINAVWTGNSTESDAGESERRVSDSVREYTYSLRQSGQMIGYAASVTQSDNVAIASPTSEPVDSAATASLQALPFVVTKELAVLPVELQVEKLFAQDYEDLKANVESALRSYSLPDPQQAYVLLHETAEVGMVDGYLRSKDRRWLCDGIANYLAWRIVRDLHGPELARQVYDVDDQLVQYAGLRSQINLRSWPAAENQTDTDRETELNKAHYAFATRAVFLMHERHGDDILPRLLGEVRKTPVEKADMRTVERAWRKITRTRLDTIINDATKPMRAQE